MPSSSPRASCTSSWSPPPTRWRGRTRWGWGGPSGLRWAPVGEACRKCSLACAAGATAAAAVCAGPRSPAVPEHPTLHSQSNGARASLLMRLHQPVHGRNPPPPGGQVCEARGLTREMVFVLGRMGSADRALRLIVEGLRDVGQVGPVGPKWGRWGVCGGGAAHAGRRAQRPASAVRGAGISGRRGFAVCARPLAGACGWRRGGLARGPAVCPAASALPSSGAAAWPRPPRHSAAGCGVCAAAAGRRPLGAAHRAYIGRRAADRQAWAWGVRGRGSRQADPILPGRPRRACQRPDCCCCSMAGAFCKSVEAEVVGPARQGRW